MRPIKDLPQPVQHAVALVRQHTSGKQAVLAGPIMPKWLPAAMPPYGARCSKMDMIALLLLTEIVAAYRHDGQEVFFRGFAYQINRSDLAARWLCKPAEITRALTFLVKHGLVERTHRAHKGVDGEYAGKAAFVIPVVEKILERIDQAKHRSEASEPFFKGTSGAASEAPSGAVSGTPPRTQEHFSPKSATSAAKAAEAADGAAEATGATSRPASASTGPEAGSASDGPSAASAAFAAPLARQTTNYSPSTKPDGDAGGEPSAPLGNQAPQSAGGAKGRESSPSGSGAQCPTPQDSSNLFVALWTESIQRVNLLEIYRADTRDTRAAINFFTENPAASVPWLIGIALEAWSIPDFDAKLGRRDRFYACRNALTISAFFHLLTRIQAELHADNPNSRRSTYSILRHVFLDAELREMGLGQMVLDNMGRSRSTKDYWEHAYPDSFREYYLCRNRRVPEIAALSPSTSGPRPKQANSGHPPPPVPHDTTASSNSPPDSAFKPTDSKSKANATTTRAATGPTTSERPKGGNATQRPPHECGPELGKVDEKESRAQPAPVSIAAEKATARGSADTTPTSTDGEGKPPLMTSAINQALRKVSEQRHARLKRQEDGDVPHRPVPRSDPPKTLQEMFRPYFSSSQKIPTELIPEKHETQQQPPAQPIGSILSAASPVPARPGQPSSARLGGGDGVAPERVR